MTKKTRRTLLVIMILLFAFFAPVIILYSLGYRFNVETFQLTETGALSIRVSPNGALITVDGKDRGVSPKTLRSLVPRDYHVAINKEGHHFWEKTLTIQPQLVTEARDVILPPLQISLDVVVDNEFDSIFFSPSGDWLIGIIDTTLYRYSVHNGELEGAIALPADYQKQDVVSFSPSEDRLIINQPIVSLIVSFNESPAVVATLLSDLFWGPKSDADLFRIALLEDGRQFLQRIDLTEFTATTFSKPLAGVSVTSDAFMVRIEDPTPHIEFWDEEGESLGIIILLEGGLNDPLLLPSPESTRNILVLRNESSGQTWIYDGREEKWHDVGMNVNSVIPAFDEKKVAIVGKDGLLSVLWLQDEEIQPRRRQGDVEVITRSSNLTSPQWMYGGFPYIFATYGNRIWLTELDGRGNRNKWGLITLRSPTIYTFIGSDELYILSGGVAYKTSLKL